MSTFSNAWPVIRLHEVGAVPDGGFVDHPDDPGGATKWGVSLRWLRSLGDLDGDGWLDGDLDHDGDVDVGDIRLLSESTAMAMYQERWWNRYEYGRLQAQPIATKIMDLAVNMGSVQAHKIAQRALRGCGRHLADDGILGPRTREALNLVDPAHYRGAICCEAAGFYRGLVMQNAVKIKCGITERDFSVFLGGWLNRAYYWPHG